MDKAVKLDKMKLCGSVSWCRIGWLVVLLNLLFSPIFSYSQNLPPVPDRGIPNQHAEVGSVFLYPIPANAYKDENNDQLDYSINGFDLPAGLIYDPNTRTINGTPTNIGAFTVPVNVTDGGSTVQTSFRIIVHAQNTTYAAFTMDYQTGCNYRLVQFKNKSKNAGSYLWTLGNGNNSSVFEPAAIYNKPGTYTVSLTINGGGLPELTHTEIITIYPNPAPVIDNVNSGCEPLTVTLNSVGAPTTINASTINGQQVGAVTGGAENYYYWYFYEKHEGVFSTSSSTTVAGFDYGKYNVNLEVTDQNGCNGTVNINNLFEAYGQPDASFTFHKSNNCEPSLTTFTDNSTIEGSTISNYNWTVNGNSLTQHLKTVDYDFTPLGPGNYIITLQTTSTKACISPVFTDTVRFNNQNTANFTMGGDSLFCTGDSVLFQPLTSPGAETYIWDIDNNGNIESTEKDFNYPFTSPGTHNVKLTVGFNDGCSREKIKSVYIDQLTANFNYTYNYDCISSFVVNFSNTSSSFLIDPITSIRWYWVKEGGNVLLSTLQNFQHSFPEQGSYKILLEVENLNSCSQSITKIIDLHYPNLSINVTGSTSGCLPAGATNFEAVFSSTNETPLSYNWDFGDSNTGTGKTISHTYTTTGNFIAKLTVATATCTYQKEVPAAAYANPPTINSLNLIQPDDCYSSGVQLQVGYSAGTDAIIFDTPSGRNNETSLTPSPYTYTYIPPAPGLFDVTVTLNNNGCLSAPQTINNINTNEPKAFFSPDQTSFCAAPPYVLQFNNLSTFTDPGTTFEWDFGDGQTSTSFDPNHTYANTGDYKVTLKAIHPTNGCEDVYSDSIFIYSFSHTPGIITANKNSGCAPFSVQFSQTIESSLSTNFHPVEFEWDFNNDGISDTISYNDTILYTFEEPGVYSVRLIAKNNSTCEYEFTELNMIEVNGPIANFSFTSPSCLEQPILFNNLTIKSPADPANINNYGYKWDFGDFGGSTQKNPFHTYANNGIYSVSLIVVDENSCSDTLKLTDTLTIQPFNVRFSVSDTLICDNAAINFQNQSVGNILEYRWDFDSDGIPDSTSNSFSDFIYTYTAIGEHFPTLEALSADGCTQTYTRKITVVDVTADFTFSPAEVVCAPTFINFEPLANVNEVEHYYWDFGNGNTSISRSPKNYYNLPGNYTVRLTIDFKGNCTITSTQSIIVDGAYGDFIYDNTPGCAPNNVLFSVENMSKVSYIKWDFGTGIIKTDTILNGITKKETEYAYANGGYATPRVLLTDSVCGEYTYYNTALGNIYTSARPVVNFTTDKDSVCKGVQIKFNDNSFSPDPVYGLKTWTWFFADSKNSTSNNQNPAFTYREKGTYSPGLLVENELGCTSSLTKNNSIDIFSNADLRANYIINDYLACPNQQLELNSQASAGPLHTISSWEWNYGDGYISGSNMDKHAFNENFKGQSVQVWHKVTDEQFCTDSTFRTVDINNLQAGFDYGPQPVYRGSLVDFWDNSTSDFNTEIVSRNWTFEDAQPATSPDSLQQDVTFLNIKQDVVTLKVTNNNNCEATTSLLIEVLNNRPEIKPFLIKMIENRSYTFNINDFDNNTEILADHFYPNDEGQELYFLKIEQTPANGILLFNNNLVISGSTIPASQIGLLVFSPNSNWKGTTYFRWNGNDGIDWANQSEIVTIEVIPEPDPPVLENIIYSAPEDSVFTISKDDFLDHMSSYPGFTFDSLTLTNISAGAGVLTFNGNEITANTFVIRGYEIDNSNAVLVFTPSFGYNGDFTFNWNAYDGFNYAESPALGKITYYNTRPDISDIVIDSIKQGAMVAIPRDTFLVHFFDPDIHDKPGNFILNVLPSTSIGTFYLNDKPIIGTSFFTPFDSIVAIRFKPVDSFEGTVTVNWILSDGTNNDMAQILMTFINTPPDVNFLNVEGIEDTPLNFIPYNFNNTTASSPFTDIDPGDKLEQISINSLPENGILLFNNNPVSVGTVISRGQIIQLVYQPDIDWNGLDKFDYNASDGTDWAPKPSTVYINITPVNDAPRPLALNWTIAEDHMLNNVSVAGNYDIDNIQNELRYSIAPNDSASAGQHGKIHLDIFGMLSFTPEKDYFGTVQFTYTVCDDDLTCGTAIVTLNITPINDAPLAFDDTIYIFENGIPTSINCLINDTDIDSQNLQLYQLNNDILSPIEIEYGTLNWETSGVLSFTLANSLEYLAEGDTVQTVFDYTVQDDSLASDEGKFIVFIIGQNDSPVAKKDVYIAYEGFDSIFSSETTYFTITSNDTDIDQGDQIIISEVNDNTLTIIENLYGWFYWNPDGSWSFKEKSAATDTLYKGELIRFGYPYKINDGISESLPDSIIFEFTGVNDAPFALNDTLVLYEDQTEISIGANNAHALLYNDYDIDDDNFWVHQVEDNLSGVLLSEAGIGLLEWNNNGSYIFSVINTEVTNQLGENDSLVITFNYTLIDENDASGSANLFIIIKGINDPPEATNDNAIVHEDDQILKRDSINGLLSNDGDPDISDQHKIIVDINGEGKDTINGQYGILIWQENGAYEYQMYMDKVNPFYKDILRKDEFTYYAKDPSGAKASAKLTINIIGDNDPPFANDQLVNITEDDSIEITSPESGILAYDFDIDTIGGKDAFGITRVNQDTFSVVNGRYGYLQWNYNGTYRYILNDDLDSLAAEETVRDTFVYEIEDLHDSIDQALFIIEILGLNDKPTAVIDTLDITEDTIDFTPDVTVLNNDFDIDGDAIQLHSLNNTLTSPTITKFAEISWTKNGTYTYHRNKHTEKSDGLDTLAFDDFIIDTIPYSIVDTFNFESISYLRLGIQGLNDNPVAVGDTNYISQYEKAISGNGATSLLANDYDVDRRDEIRVLMVNNETDPYVQGKYGELTWNNDGSYNYNWFLINDTLAEGESVVDLFRYTITDLQDSTASDTLMIFLTGQNDVPYARNDTVEIYEDEGFIELTGNVALLYNDEDIDNDPIHLLLPSPVSVSDSGRYGVLTLFDNGDGRYDLYSGLDTLYQGEKVVDTFSYSIADNKGADSTATLFMIIIGQNDSPIANDDENQFINEDTLSVSSIQSLLTNDRDTDKDWFYVSNINGSSNRMIQGNYGSLSWDSLGNYTYYTNHEITNHLAMGDTVFESFTYVISDIFNGTASANFNISITGENDPIVAKNDTVWLDEDKYIKYNVLKNDEDPENNIDPGSLKIISTPKNGKGTVNSANGEIIYFPNNNYNGIDSLLYQVCDTGNPIYCSQAWFITKIRPINDPPIPNHLILRTPINTPVDFNVFDQVVDIDDGIDPESFNLLTDNVNVSRNFDSIYTYTPETDFSGRDEFTYSLSDYSGEQAAVIVTVIVQNDGLGAKNDTVYTNENTAINISILENDKSETFHPNPLSVEIKIFPKHGTAAYNINQTIYYLPREGFNGTDSLSYMVGSREGTWDFAKVYIHVQPLNSPIIVRDDAVKTTVNTPVEIAILNNDEDEDNGIDYRSVMLEQPNTGIVSYDETSGLVSFTPETGFTGILSFSYTVCDLDPIETSCDQALVTVLVRDSIENIFAANDNYATNEDTAIQLVNPLPTDNDIIINGSLDLESFKVIRGPDHGSYSIDPNNVLTYSPALNFFGPDWIKYQISDITGTSTDMAEINLWVDEVNDAPIAINDTFMVTENTIKRFYILANDFDIEGYLNYSTLDTIAGKGPKKGDLVIDRNTGTVLYSPKINADTDEFTYQICDNEGLCSTATVFITINLGTTIYYQQVTYEDTPDTFNIKPLLDDYNLFFDIDRAVEKNAPKLGSWSLINNNTQIVYRPSENLYGPDFYQLLLYAANGDSADLQVTVKILPVNDAPVAVTDTIIWGDSIKGISVQYDFILANDYDVDGDSIFLSNAVIDQGDQSMSIVFDQTDSTITIKSDSMLWCDAWFTYQISDTALSAIGLVKIIPPLTGMHAENDTSRVNENNSLNYNNQVEISILDNDDIKDNQLCTIDTFYLSEMPQNGIAAINSSETILYRPNDHYFGNDSIQYIIADIWGQTDSAWAIITVVEINVPPYAQNDSVTSNLGEVSNIDVLANDYDPDPDGYIDTTRTTVIDLPLYGTLLPFDSINGFSYIPEAFSCDDDFFSYVVFDNKGGSDTARVNINFPNEAEIFALTDTVRTYPGISIDFNVLTNDEGFFLPFIEYYEQALYGSITQTGDSTFTYFPNINFVGRDSMTYQLISPCGNQTTGQVIFIVEKLKIPEIITPNNDGKNDVLIIDGIEYFPTSLLQIFNRNGHLVYQSKGYENNWDGHSNQGSFGGDKPLPGGTYFYTLIYNEGINRQSGFIYINR